MTKGNKSLDTAKCPKCGLIGQRKHLIRGKKLYEYFSHYGKDGNARIRFYRKFHHTCYIEKVV